MTVEITLQEYEEVEKVREKEIKSIIKQACKLFDGLDTTRVDKFTLLKYEACVEDLKNIPNILSELKRIKNNIIEEKITTNA